MEGYPTAVGVCGTHGKTTTTSMIAQILLAADSDPTIHIGGSLDMIGGNVRTGKGDIFLTEACEFNLSFLHLKPTIAVITNIDEDHLDFFRDLDDIQNAFGIVSCALFRRTDTAIGNGDDARIAAVFSNALVPNAHLWFRRSLRRTPWQTHAMTIWAAGRFSRYRRRIETLGRVSLQVAGDFNVYNALAAAACAYVAGLDMATACDALSQFHGARPPFELTGIIDGVEALPRLRAQSDGNAKRSFHRQAPAAQPPVGRDAAAHLQPGEEGCSPSTSPARRRPISRW